MEIRLVVPTTEMKEDALCSDQASSSKGKLRMFIGFSWKINHR